MDLRFVNALVGELNEKIAPTDKEKIENEAKQANSELIKRHEESEICKDALHQTAVSITNGTTLDVIAFRDHKIQFKLESEGSIPVDCQSTFQHCVLPALGIPRRLCEHIYLEEWTSTPLTYRLLLTAKTAITKEPVHMSIFEPIDSEMAYEFQGVIYTFDRILNKTWCAALRNKG